MVPSDACRYHRPFADNFADCPGYDAAKFDATTMRDRPLAPIWTCAQLAVGEYPGRRGQLYAKCLLGDAAARRQVILDKLIPHYADATVSASESRATF